MTISTFNLSLAIILMLSNPVQSLAQSKPSIAYKDSISYADSLFATSNWAQAKQMYESVLTDDAVNSLAWNRLGYSNYQLENYDAALICFRKSLSQNPPLLLKGVVYSRMARIYTHKNDKQIALAMLDSAANNSFSNSSEMDTLIEYIAFREDAYFKQLKNRVYINGNPCMGNPHAREFDFWVGEWDVHPTGSKQTVAGHSLIQIIAGGCAILENWDSPASNGKSINFIDPVTNKWKQSWAGNYASGIQEFVNGEYKEGAMRFTFESTDSQGKKVIGRFIFFNEGPNQVRQFNETSYDGGKTWATSYDLTYVRRR